MCFKKQEQKEKVCELPYKIERPVRERTIADVEADIRANGFRIIRHHGMLDFKTVPVRKHKRYRVQKKWIKRFGTKVKSYPIKQVYIYGDKIIGHPVAIKNYLNECLKN